MLSLQNASPVVPRMYCKPDCLQARSASGKQQRCMQLPIAYCKQGRGAKRGQQEGGYWGVSIALLCLFGAVAQTVQIATPLCASPVLLQQLLVHLVGADVHHLEDARALELLVDISINRGIACRVQVVSGTACCSKHWLLQPAGDSVHICSLPMGERYSCA